MLAISSIGFFERGPGQQCVVKIAAPQLRGGQSKDARWEAMSMWLSQKSAAKGIWRYMWFGLRALPCSSRSTLCSITITTCGSEEKDRPQNVPWASPIRWMQPFTDIPEAHHLVMTSFSLHMFISRIIRGFVGRLPLNSKLLVMVRFVSIL
ncbi:hypothetical protein V8C43DRAFT_182867 [Trichoderma afarasin]